MKTPEREKQAAQAILDHVNKNFALFYPLWSDYVFLRRRGIPVIDAFSEVITAFDHDTECGILLLI